MEKLNTQPEQEDQDTAELDRRSDGFIDVKLMWHRPTDTPYIVLEEIKQHTAYAFIVKPEDCLDAFMHPYPYMELEGLVVEGRAA